MRVGRMSTTRTGRLPPGRRGLKHWLVHCVVPALRSPSPRKAWIETQTLAAGLGRYESRLPPGRRGLKLGKIESTRNKEESPSPRKAWIETALTGQRGVSNRWVAFPPEGVD